ncbi:MAG TPA: peptidoglycan-binding protein [Candidatus Paceibacterota bacterium]
MNKRTIIAVTLGLLLGVPAFAANNDIVLNSGTQISIDSVTLTVSGSQASAMTVNASNFEVTMPTGSTIEVSAAGLRRLAYSSPVNTLTTNNDCSADRSKLTVTNNDSGTVNVTFSLGTGTCGDGAASSSGGGGGPISSGGGGGGGYIPSVTPSNPATTTTTSVTTYLTASPLVALTGQTVTPTNSGTSGKAVSSFVFIRSLSLGVSGSDVTELQRVLALDPTLYPEANLSGYFGGLTQKAVQRFQVRYGIAVEGAQGYGVFGPATRAKFASVYGISTAMSTPAGTVSSGILSVSLKKGVTHAQVKLLQQILNKDSDTMVATEGAGSAGNETSLFGSLTEKAVIKFQTKYGIDPIGIVGPMTRAKLNSI